jgi:hypothetical protein
MIGLLLVTAAILREVAQIGNDAPRSLQLCAGMVRQHKHADFKSSSQYLSYNGLYNRWLIDYVEFGCLRGRTGKRSSDCG